MLSQIVILQINQMKLLAAIEGTLSEPYWPYKGKCNFMVETGNCMSSDLGLNIIKLKDWQAIPNYFIPESILCEQTW